MPGTLKAFGRLGTLKNKQANKIQPTALSKQQNDTTATTNLLNGMSFSAPTIIYINKRKDVKLSTTEQFRDDLNWCQEDPNSL